MYLISRIYPLVITCIFLIMVIACPALAGGASDNDTRHYKVVYQVKRDGADIGTYRFDIRETGQRYSFEARLDIEVTVFGFTVYELRHRRSEQWHGDRLVSLQGRSVYDDDKRYTIDLGREGEGYTLKVNDKTRKLEARVVSFSPRQPGAWRKARLISLKGDANAVTKQNLGKAELKLNDTTRNAAHYRLKGDVVRDLWYDEDGRLIKLSYDKDGATITFRRTAIVEGE